MKIEDRILKLLNCKYQDTEIFGLRFVVKINENSWRFRYAYRDGDYLSLSDEYKVMFDGLNLVLEEKSIFISPGVFTREKDNTINKNKQK